MMTQSSPRRPILGLVLALLSAGPLTAQGANQFPKATSPGEGIQAAARAVVQDRTKTGSVDILSDTEGVDFGPYLKRALSLMRQEWYARIPESAQTKKGKVAIEFSILKDGHIANMKLVATSGDMSLDRAAWSGIAASNPLPPLPSEFSRPYIALRCRFYYNPDKSDLSETQPANPDPTTHAVLIQSTSNANLPKYPQKALDAKIEGFVRLEGTVGTNGELRGLKVVEGNPELGAAAISAISKWRFRPAAKNSKSIEEQTRINVTFRLNPERVRAQIVWPEATSSGKPIQ
jgi:TonB family protein